MDFHFFSFVWFRRDPFFAYIKREVLKLCLVGKKVINNSKMMNVRVSASRHGSKISLSTNFWNNSKMELVK